jgi:membrane-associated phospholipid phosphatase
MGYNLLKHLDKYYTLGFIGLITSSLLADIIKRLPYPKSWEFFITRPKGANNWDILSKNDYSDKINPPGFPSGHMTSATFFSAYIFLGQKTNKWEKIALLGIVLLTGWARYVKGVHNMPQILAGVLLGLIVAKVFINFNESNLN